MIKKAILRLKLKLQIKFNLTLSLNDSIFIAPEKIIIAESTLIVKLFVYLVLINFSKMNRSVQYV